MLASTGLRGEGPATTPPTRPRFFLPFFDPGNHVVATRNITLDRLSCFPAVAVTQAVEHVVVVVLFHGRLSHHFQLVDAQNWPLQRPHIFHGRMHQWHIRSSHKVAMEPAIETRCSHPVATSCFDKLLLNVFEALELLGA